MNKIKFFSAFFIILASVFYIGCGEDSVPNNGGGTGTAPTINMKVNSLYGFTNDSLDTNGTTRSTRIRTIQTIIAEGTFFLQPNAFAVRTESRDTVSNTLVGVDTFYVRYADGKFYQYGMLRLIDPTQTEKWDLVADFNLAHGTQWDIGTISTTISGFAVTSNVKGKVAANTPFTTNNTGLSINNYQIEIEAPIVSLGQSLGSIFVDYYIGYSDPATNPAGMVRLKLRPIHLQSFGITIYRAAGADQKIDYYVIP